MNKTSGNAGYERKWLILAAVMLGNIMMPIDASIINTVLPTITRHFNSQLSLAQWVPTVYLLTISSLLLLYGRLGDMWGYKKVYITGLAGFIVSSVLCAVSPSMEALIVFRAIQGLSAGMTMAVSFAIVTAAFPPSERGKALGISAMGIAVGLALGPTLGGTITGAINWRYIFFINVPIGLAALSIVPRVIPAGIKRPGQRLDIPGAVLAFVMLFSFLLFANRGDTWGWTSLGSVALLMIALLATTAFFVTETRVAQPMLNLKLFSDRAFTLASLSSMLNFMAQFTMVFLTPFYMALVLHYAPNKVGYIMSAGPLVMLIVAPISGSLSDRIGSRALAAFGMAASTLGLFLMTTLDGSSQALDVVWRLTIFGFAIGLFQSPNNSAVMGSVPPQYLGIASGILASMRNVGMVLGIAIAGAVLYSFSSPDLSPGGDFDSQAFLTGLHRAYLAGAVLSGIAIFTSIASGKKKKALSGTAGGKNT